MRAIRAQGIRKALAPLLTLALVISAIALPAALPQAVLAATEAPNPDKAPYTQEEINDAFKDEDGKQTDGKQAFWTSADKSTADIVISYKKEVNDALYLASLCNGHGLNEDRLNQEITAVAQLANLNLYLEGRDMYGTPYMDEAGTVRAWQSSNVITNQRGHFTHNKMNSSESFSLEDSHIANTAEGPTTGADVRVGEYITPTAGDTTRIRTNGEHASIIDFANDIVEAFEGGNEPDFVVMSFDAWVWAAGGFAVENSVAADAQVMRKAAEYLAPLYAENRVIWLTDAGNVSGSSLKSLAAVSGGTYPARASNALASFTEYAYPDNVEDFNENPKPSTFFAENNTKEGSYYSIYGQNFTWNPTSPLRETDTQGRYLRDLFRAYSFS